MQEEIGAGRGQQAGLHADEDDDVKEHFVVVAGFCSWCDEFTIAKFFAGVGQANDVQIRRRLRTGRSLGVARAEFSRFADACVATGLSGCRMQNRTVLRVATVHSFGG